MKKRFMLFVVMIVFLCCGCQDSDMGRVKLHITNNFGEETIFSQEIQIGKDSSVLQVLMESGLEIATNYGGSFIDGIEGHVSKNNLETGTREDWFFYVNGVFSDVGPGDYFLSDGDIIWWDYHPWKMGHTNSPVVVAGFFPEPFSNGYLNANEHIDLVVDENYLDSLNDIKSKITGKKEVRFNQRSLPEFKLTERDNPSLVVARVEDLLKSPDFKKINDDYKKSRTFIQVQEEKVIVLDSLVENEKEIAGEYSAIFAYGEMGGEANPVVFIVGNSERKIEEAIDYYSKDSDMTYLSLVFTDNEIIPLPLR